MNQLDSDWNSLSKKCKSVAELTENGLDNYISIIEEYGKTGKLTGQFSLNTLDTLIMTVSIGEALFEQQTDSLVRLKNSLTLFFARLKLDVESRKELSPFLEDARVLVTKLNGISESYFTVHELGLLWGMSPNTVRGEVLSNINDNLLYKKSNMILIPSLVALSLSLERRGFHATEDNEVEGMILVPVTIKGEYFNYQCRNKNGYRIGRKGNEYLVSDFDSALSQLREMRPKAYWRRKNLNGNWGIVAAIRWELRHVSIVKGE